ncbi:MAG: sulfatase-like hydrolase/transferase [Planctomycetota bacterium]|jgi:arylsulfatase K
MTRPNILVIQTDSQDGRVFGAMGHPAMGRATPNMDALAAGGTMFTTAYCNNPICCPSRASMWSGQYTHRCEGWNNYKGLELETPTFRTRLDEAGYHTQTYGKTDYLSGAHTIRARVTAWLRSARIMRPTYREHAPNLLDHSREQVHDKDWDDVERTVAFLAHAAQTPERPFLLYLGIRAPHPGFTTNQRYWERVDPDGVELPPPDAEDHPVMEYMRVSKNWEHGWDEPMTRRVRRTYFAMIAEVDAMVGRVMTALKELGLDESTYVVFTSDHGELAGEHEQYYKMNLYEASARVPLIVSGPGVRTGATVDAPVSLVDIYPTLMDMAGLDRPEGLDGRSLIPAVTGSAAGLGDWVLSEYHDTTCCTGSFMLRRGDWKYVAYPGYAPQLFNLADDPWEVRNLAASSPDVVADMDAMLREIVDCDAVDAKVKAYDRESFRRWRHDQRGVGTYGRNMAIIHSGWTGVTPETADPWTREDEEQVEEWLSQG